MRGERRANLGDDWLRLRDLLHAADFTEAHAEEARELVGKIVERRLLALEIPDLIANLGPLLDVWRNDGAGLTQATEAEYAALGALYSYVAASGAIGPTNILADALGVKVQAIMSRVTEARHLGVLGPTPRGKPGGEITPKGFLLLEAATGGKW